MLCFGSFVVGYHMIGQIMKLAYPEYTTFNDHMCDITPQSIYLLFAFVSLWCVVNRTLLLLLNGGTKERRDVKKSEENTM